MRFEDIFFNKKSKYSLGIDHQTKQNYLSIPVKNSKIDYEEYYALRKEEFAEFRQDHEKAALFAESCRERLHDDRLILAPGTERGKPW